MGDAEVGGTSPGIDTLPTEDFGRSECAEVAEGAEPAEEVLPTDDAVRTDDAVSTDDAVLAHNDDRSTCRPPAVG
jgi:hypothetical protein